MELIDKFNTVFLRTYTYRILLNFLDLAGTLVPYLIAGILVVAVLQRNVLKLQKLSFLRSGKPLNIMAAALAGVLAPLPVYVAVPFSAVLIANGMPAAVVLAFLVACPLIDLAPRLAGLLDPGGSIVLSGILATQANAVADSYAPFCHMQPPVGRDEWVLLQGRRR